MRQIRWVLAVVTVALLASAGPSAAGSRWVLTIRNLSEYDIYQLFISSSELTRWGPNLLGWGVLSSGTYWTISEVVTGEYDVKFVDEDGDDCVLRNIPITKNTVWDLTTDWLLRCEFHRTAERIDDSH